jgi:flagellar protein FlaG
MSFEIGPLSSAPAAASTPSRRAATPGFQTTLAAAPAVDVAQIGISPSPPPEVLDAVGVAADRADAMAAENRQLHFDRDEKTGRVVVQLLDLTSGEVIRTIPPSAALTALSGPGA